MNAVASFFTNLMRRWLPDPLVIAIILTLLAMILAMTWGGSTPMMVVQYWGDGFWNLLAFTMQMTVILLAGYMLAKTPIVDRLLDRLAETVKSPRAAIILITLVGGIGSWLNWGFGLVAGGIIGRKIAGHVKGLHYPLAIAAGYSGFSVYGIGLSGTVPLLIATEDNFVQEQMGGTVPLSETILGPWVGGMAIATIVLLPLFNAFMHPKDPSQIKEYRPAEHDVVVAELEPLPEDESRLFGPRMNDSPLWGILIGAIGLVYAVMHFVNGGQLDLNIVNIILLMLGMLMFARPRHYLHALNDAVKVVAGVIVQYPFYAGIMAILVGSGLIVSFSELFTSISTAETLPLWSFISGGITNILVPSGGGQFAVQGPVMLEASNALGANNAAVALAVQIGDQWTNLVQPFWVVPVLAITGLKLKDVMGYMVLILAFVGVIFGVGVGLWGFLG
ncbi:MULTISPECIES: short-chain fatty acid transporter [Trueperella]|uniref:Short-chain fatty acids transporter n=1 Tax=Trueperella abortisuis TaxID=445930 RepID=A0ABT9PG74_9ACTO|nr:MULTISPECIES: TIGR00366 family protein [Trueperella]MCI7305871.1 TIGR00366 family protein [Trueperella sp.]MDP9831709.1 short-chain fatty acids transporter [Trueperella abortisuis]MDY5403917.1 TIGR00366 family protein [Trueperella sp.]